MNCVESQENLTALLHHELSLSEEQTVREHLSQCEACREQQQKIAAVMKTVRQFVPIEPSARARSELQDRIEDVIKREKSAESSDRSEKDKPPQWKLVSPAPPALPYEQPKALPPPSPDKKPEVAALSPSARAVSQRLAATSTRMQKPPVSSKFVFGFVIVCLAFCATLAALMYLRTEKQPEDPAARQERLAATRRLEDRQAAKVRGKKSDTLISTQVQLGDIIAEDAELRIVPHYDPVTGEICLIAYREEDLQKLRNDPAVDQPALETMMQRAIVVHASNGKFVLPREMVATYVGLDHKAAIVDMENRIEIWSAPRLDSYLAREAKRPPPSVPASNGLPPEK